MKLGRPGNFLRLTVLAAILFAGGGRAAEAQIDVSAPTDVQVKTLGDWYEQHMPIRFRARDSVDVSVLTSQEMAAYLKGGDPGSDPAPARAQADDDNADGDIDGVFEDGPPRIILRLPDSGEPDVFTFAHEYGHYVWFKLLGKSDRARYTAIYNKQRAAHHLVTRYAATELEEGFAEAFSFFVNQPPLLAHRDSLSYQFLAQCVGVTHSR